MSILEFHFVNPLTIGALGSAIDRLVNNCLIVFGFGMTAYWIVKYLRKFYGGRPIPQEWRLFWTAMVWGTLHELIEVPIVYKWVTGQALMIVFLFIQLIAGTYLIRGSYLLAKKHIPE